MRSPAVIKLIFGLFSLVLSATACKPSRVASQPTGSDGSLGSAATAVAPHCKILRDQLCAQFGTSSDECRMVEDQIQRFSPDGCLSMLSRYDETAKSTAGLVKGQKALVSPEQNTLHGPAPSIGVPGAPITMVLFADFESPDCSRGSGMATTIRNVYSDKVRLVFRQFPLSGNKDAHLAAEASLAAHAQGKFWAYYEVLFGNEHSHDRASLERYAKEAGLDLPALRKALDRHTFAADVDADRDLGKKLNVSVLPALFVNGKHVRFPYGVVELSEVIDQALAPKP
jgi:protein-disulfide isomerase